MSSEPASRPAAGGWQMAVVTMVVVQMATAFLSRIPPTLAPVLAPERGWSDAVVGYLASLNTVGSILFLALGAPILRRLGSIRALQLGLLLGIAGLVLLWPSSVLVAGLASALIGVGYGPSSPAGNDVLHRVSPARHRAVIFSIKQAGVPVGGIVAGLALPPLVDAYGWQAALVASAIFVVLIVLAVQPMRETLDIDRTRDERLHWRALFSLSNMTAPLRALTTTHAIRRLATAGACLAIGQGIWFAYLMTIMVSALQFDLAGAGIAFAFMQATSVAGRIMLGWLSDRRGRPRLVLAWIGVASAVTSTAMAFVTPAWSLTQMCLLAAVAGISVSSWNGVLLSEIAKASRPDLIREASSGAVLVIFVGYVVGPAAFAALLTGTGSIVPGFLGCAAFGIVGTFMVQRLSTVSEAATVAE